MTIDFLIGFATPGSRVVKMSPQGLKGWFAYVIHRTIRANDGAIYLNAVRLLGVTVGCTITREMTPEVPLK
jgi:hypothetical protein